MQFDRNDKSVKISDAAIYRNSVMMRHFPKVCAQRIATRSTERKYTAVSVQASGWQEQGQHNQGPGHGCQRQRKEYGGAAEIFCILR
jgi:hypothetical protein